MDIAIDEPAIASLRRETRARHDLLESVLRLVEPQPLARTRYLLALTGFDLFLTAWEPRLAAALPAALRDGFASRSRQPLLRRDLALLGGRRPCPPGLDEACAAAARGIGLGSVAAAFGSMYVLEGSALGGQVIAKVARDTLGFGPDNGAAYFNGSERDTAAHWKLFLALLELHVGAAHEARREACEAARQTFDALIDTFTLLQGTPDVA